MPYALNVFVVCHNLILTQYWNYCYQLNPETFIKKLGPVSSVKTEKTVRVHLYPVQQYVYNNETRLSLTLPKTSPIKYLSIRFFFKQTLLYTFEL